MGGKSLEIFSNPLMSAGEVRKHKEKIIMSNIAEQAWNETRVVGDPLFSAIPEREFRENLEFRAQKVKETGIATTNFEKKVAALLLSDEYKDSGAMAVVAPTGNVNLKAAADGLVERTPEQQAAIDKADADAKQAEIDAHQNAIKALKEEPQQDTKRDAASQIDTSGHVATPTEAGAALREEETAPAK